jgi:anti-sigma B factor antagonist
MQMSIQRIEKGIKRISLAGRMDIPGTNEIDLRLSAETASEKAFVVLDLTSVEFLASVGIGALVHSVKALRLRGGEAVFLSTVPIVTLVLEKTLITQVIKVFSDLESACQSLSLSMDRLAFG